MSASRRAALAAAHDDDMQKEAAILKSLHRGQSREDFYRVARALGVVPRNSDYVRRSDSGPPISNGDFPHPDAGHAHPSVRMHFRRPGGILLWQEDEVMVYFDEDEKVSYWTKRTYETGV